MTYSVINIEDIDPDTVRCPIAGPDGMTFVSVGARPGAYEARGPF
jgi:hypothetical protein